MVWKARTIGAKLKSQSRVVLNPHFQIETIDGRPPQRHPRGQLQGSQRLRGKLRDGAGNLSQACRTSSSDHGNLRSHARATRHSQLTFSWCRTRDNLSSHCCPARPAWVCATRALLQGRHTVKSGRRSIQGSGQERIRSARADTEGHGEVPSF